MSDVVIVGAGVAGLVCAAELAAGGLECVVLEAGEGAGGRVRTDRLDGYLLDRGFQILLTAYPEVQARLDLDELALGLFAPGAIVRVGGRFARVSDPRRRPRELLETLRAPVGSPADKLRLAMLALDVSAHGARELLRRPDTSTAERLRRAGFSARAVEAFWRPLFAGIQLDPALEVSSRRFEVILRMLALGETGLPAGGIGAVTAQLEGALAPGTVRLGARVVEVQGTSATLEGGERLSARALVVAGEGPAAHALLGERVPDPGSRAAACCWFTTPGPPPLRGPWLVLDGEASGPARNVVFMSEVAPSYAPPGRTLVAAAVPGPEALMPGLGEAVARQLAGWFGSMTGDWTLLRTDVIPHGQPLQTPPLSPRRRVDLGEGVFVCGDHRDTASLQGAMFSGQRAARAVLERLRGTRAPTSGTAGEGR